MKNIVLDEIAIPAIDTSNLVKKTEYEVKVKDIEDKIPVSKLLLIIYTDFQIQYLMKD